MDKQRTAKRIREERTRIGLSRKDLASLIGVSERAVIKWEQAQRTPLDEHKVKLAKTFNRTIEYLFF